MDSVQKKIVEEVSKELDLPKEKVEELYLSYIKYMKMIIEEGEHDQVDTFKNFRIPHFGIFYFNRNKYEGMIKNINNLKKQINNDG